MAAYRKVHLFDVDVPNGPILMESRTTAPGHEVCWAASQHLLVSLHNSLAGCNLCTACPLARVGHPRLRLLPACLHACCLQLVVCDSPAGRLALTVCYDLRFPEVYQALAWGLGANVLLVPSAFTKVTGMQRLAAC